MSKEFPITNRQACIEHEGEKTEILLTNFQDKIFIIITQYGKMGSLIQTSFDIAPHLANNPKEPPTTSQFLMGESQGLQSELYVLYATSIMQILGAMNPHEKRPLLLGIALKPKQDMTEQRKLFHLITDQVMALNS